jgi:phage tail sheath gpL-like
MQWKNTETPTFAGSNNSSVEGPDVVETMQLLDRNCSVVATFSKGVDGHLSLDMNGALSQSGLIAYRSADLSRNADNVTNQVETATIGGGPIVAEAQIIVTANGMTNSPKTVKFAVADGDTASQIATKARAALTADADVIAFFTVSGATTAVILTARTEAANDGTMNMASDNDTCGGLTPAASSANTTAGVAPVLQVETATVVGTIDAGTLQVETATIVGTIDPAGAGDAEVIVTAAGMSNSPKTVNVAVANNDNADTVAGKIRTALGLDADISAFFTVSGATDKVILTALATAANDATMNIAVDNGTCSGLTPDATSDNTTAGAAGAGNATVIVTAAGMTGTPKTVNVAVAAGDDQDVIAGKIRAALTADADVGHVTTGFFTVSGATDKVILTAKADAANDATLNISVANGTCAGITEDLTSADTTAGVLGVLQVETATIAGTAVVECEIVVTAAGMDNSPKTISVVVADGDTASQVAGKVRTALALDEDVAAFFTVGGSGAVVSLTVLTDDDYDATMNIASDNDTCAGLTPAANSANTTSMEADPDLSVDVQIGTYLIEADLSLVTADGGMKLDLNGGTASISNVILNYQFFAGDGTIYDFLHSTALDTDAEIAAADDDDYVLQIKGSVEVSAAGTLALRWTQKIPHATDSTVVRGGWLKLTKV